MSEDRDDLEWAIAAQADAMEAMFCPSSVTYPEPIGTVYCDCDRDHEGAHTGMMRGGGWMTWAGYANEAHPVSWEEH